MIKRLLTIFLIINVLQISHANDLDELQTLAKAFFTPLPATMPGSQGDTASKIKLGKQLYFETALSVNESQSCNTCHNILDGGPGVDNLKTSPGALGSLGTRNSPSTWNAGFQFVQFWDGRAANLAEQAKSPILNPVEMAMPSEAAAVTSLTNKGYQKGFENAFPTQENPLNFDNILSALAAFQRTLITQDRFDNFLKGDINALNKKEKKGLVTFIKSGCNACHNGPLMGGELFMKMGLVNAYPNTIDKGRAQVTGNAADNFFFKVPPLRNVAQTAPYFHDGAGKTLEQAVLDTGWHQLGITLSPTEVEDIALFLRTLDNTKVDI